MPFRMSEDAKIFPLYGLTGAAGDPFGPYDIGGGDYAQTQWADMAGYDRVFAIIWTDTTITDVVDTIKLQQASAGTLLAAGTGTKDLTTSGSGTTYNYDSAAGQVLTAVAGQFCILEARAENLDSTNGFHFVRLYASCSGDTGVDNVKGFLMLHQAGQKKSGLQGAPTANTAIYVTPTSSY
jgi:hypothetical protein